MQMEDLTPSPYTAWGGTREASIGYLVIDE